MTNTIFLVEDDLPTCVLWERHLNYHGWQVESVHDFEAAQEAITQYQPDALILDLILRDHQSGWDLLALLRTWNWTRYVPVLIVSALNEARRALSSGADGFLLKPCSPSKVVDVLENLLATHRQPTPT